MLLLDAIRLFDAMLAAAVFAKIIFFYAILPPRYAVRRHACLHAAMRLLSYYDAAALYYAAAPRYAMLERY